MYNARLYKYKSGGYQMRIYSSTVFQTDEGYEPEKPDNRHLMENPFTGHLEFLEVFSDGKNFPGLPDDLTPEERDRRKARSVYSSVSRTLNMIYYLSRSNVWDWFITLTFNPEKVDSFDYSECTKKLSVWLNNCRKTCPDMKYLVVPEKHESGRYHFHGLLADCDGLGFVDSGHKSGNKVIYNIGRYKLGFSTATRVQDTERVAKYITKYITKDLCESTPDKKRYWASKNLERAEIEEMFIDPFAIPGVISTLSPFIQHMKKSGGADQEVTYIELSKEYSDNDNDS